MGFILQVKVGIWLCAVFFRSFCACFSSRSAAHSRQKRAKEEEKGFKTTIWRSRSRGLNVVLVLFSSDFMINKNRHAKLGFFFLKNDIWEIGCLVLILHFVYFSCFVILCVYMVERYTKRSLEMSAHPFFLSSLAHSQESFRAFSR